MLSVSLISLTKHGGHALVMSNSVGMCDTLNEGNFIIKGVSKNHIFDRHHLWKTPSHLFLTEIYYLNTEKFVECKFL